MVSVNPFKHRQLSFLLGLLAMAFCAMNHTSLWAQEASNGLDEVNGTAEVIVNDPDELVDARKRARDKAMINALERAYGTVIFRTNTTELSNEQVGQRARTFTRFNTIANTHVKGDWVRTLDEQFTEDELHYNPRGRVRNKAHRRGHSEYIVRARVRGLARELKTPPVRFEALTMRCTDAATCVEYDFRTGDPLYLRFRSPSAGWLSIWLDDQKHASCLLPYLNMPRDQVSGLRVEADQEYVLFSADPRHYPFDRQGFQIDELLMHTGGEHIIAERLFVIFSPEPYNTPLLEPSRQVTNRMDSALRGFQFPRKVVSEDFQEWLSLNQGLRQDFQVQVIDISVVNARR